MDQQSLRARFRQAFSRSFGEVSWTPPPWWRGWRERVKPQESFEPLRRRVAAAREWLRRHARQVRKGGAIAGALVLVLGAGYIWYANRPMPTLFSVEGTTPRATRLEDGTRPDSLTITIGGSAARLEQVDKTVTQGVEINPPIAGEWRWQGDSRLVFTPKEDWGVAQDYVVRLDQSLFPDHVKLETYEHRFTSASFDAEVSHIELYQDPKNPKLKTIVATVQFSHPVDAADFEKRVELRLAGQKTGFLGIGAESYAYTVSYNKFKGEAYIHSDPVAIPPKDSTMTLLIDSGVRSERGGNATRDKIERTVAIPGMLNYFRVRSAQPTLVRNERYEPEQVLIVNLTDGVSEQALQGALEVYLLPQDLPPLQSQRGQKNYRWYRTEEIGPEILALATKVDLQALPTDREFPVMHSFKYQAEPGRYLYIRLAKGLESAGGYVLANGFDSIQRVPPYPRELNIMYDGAILSLAGEKKVSVVARDIEGIRFEVGRVVSGQINHLVTQSSGHFRSPQFVNWNFNADNITERFTETRTLQKVPAGKSQYAGFDLSPYLSPAAGQRRGLFFLRAESWNPQTKNTTGAQDSRLILVTDLGLLVKDNADGSHDVFVQSIAGGHPVAGARVEVLGKNGITVVSDVTDGQGHASLPKLTDFKREKEPVVYVARFGEDLSFMPFQREDRKLNFSRFDIGGEQTAQAGEKLSAYLFSDRGIYRPGDTINVGLIVKSQDWRQVLAGVPIETVVIDARGMEVQRHKLSLSAAGLEAMRYTTEETVPTGNYQFSAYIVKDNRRASLLGSTTVRVEEFLPDRMKIATRFSQERAEGWVSPGDLKGQVDLKNLFGTPAAKRRVAAQVSLSPAYPAFRAYRDYQFFDPARAKNGFSERLPDGQTDDDGHAVFDLGLERFDKATYRLSFFAEGYEAEGGRSVASESSILVSPLPYLVGYKPDGDLHYVSRGSARAVEFIAIDPALHKIALPNLNSQLIELRYVSVLTQQPDGTYRYQSVRKEIPVSKRSLSIAAQGLAYPLPTQTAGDYALIVRGPDDIELSRVEFSVAGRANLTRSLDKEAELQVKLSKSDYAPGEEIELQITAPYTGAGLITIERERVYAHQWFKTGTTSSVQRIRVPAGLEGNGYVNVTFVRAMDSPEIFMSPLSYAVVPFSISRERRTNAITLEHPEIARPGEPFKIRYRTARPGRIVIMAVDEGILQVAHYQTPDPLGYFFRKRALEVETAQILDMILPEFKLIQALSAPGGGEAAEALGKNLNPFKRRRDKPVAYWSGILPSDGTEREVTYRVPDYFNGTLRVMAVAVAPEAIGVAKQQAIVRGHFVLSPNVPTAVGPGDEFDVSVGVANNLEGSGKDASVKLDLAVSEHLQVVGPAQQTLTIGEGRESVARFKLRARDVLGSGNLTFTAALGDKQSHYAVDLSVRPPMPYLTTTAIGHFKSDKADIPLTRKMYPHFRTLEASASPVPLGLARGLVNYLNKFPYGCTEQLVSQAFPAIVLRARPEFGYAPDKVEANLERVISILRARQNAEGAFGFWAANSHVSDLQTVYAMHFLTEAKERNYPVPTDLMEKGFGYLRSLAGRDADTLSRARVRAYAIYVLTRNGVVTTNWLTSLRTQLDDKFDKTWRKDLTAAYVAATYQMLKQESAGERLISDLRLGEAQTPDYEYFYDGLVYDSQLLYVIARHFPERMQRLKGEDLLAIVNPLTRHQYNTLSSAYTILALDAYVGNVALGETAQIAMSEFLAGGAERPLVLPKGLFPRVDFSPQAEKLRIASSSDYPLFYQVTQAGFDTAPPAAEIKQKIEVQREYRDAAGQVVNQIALGEELTVHIKLRSVGAGTLYNVAIVDLLPGGFEVVLDSLPRAHPGGLDTTPDSAWRADNVDAREDRVVMFGTVGESVQEYVYRIKATNRGAYTVPPVFAESMYDRTVQARGLGDRITVTDPREANAAAAARTP
jgi:alpha-2-macroglobulin